MLIHLRITSVLLSLVCTLSACTSTSSPTTPPTPQSTAPSAASDSPWYQNVTELQQASDLVALVQITGSSSTTINGMPKTLNEATVLKSEPATSTASIKVATDPDNGTAETIDLTVGRQYVLFLVTPKQEPAYLVSAGQGVFPVEGSTVGPSRSGTFTLGALAARLGLH